MVTTILHWFRCSGPMAVTVDFCSLPYDSYFDLLCLTLSVKPTSLGSLASRAASATAALGTITCRLAVK